MIDKYEIQNKYSFQLADSAFNALEYNCFITSFDGSERVNLVYDSIRSSRKFRFVFPEYDLNSDNDVFQEDASILVPRAMEGSQIIPQLKKIFFTGDFTGLCIDISGFMPPQLAVMLNWLKKQGATKLDLIYSEPKQYRNQENTNFVKGSILGARNIQGFGGSHSIDGEELLIIGCGYDVPRMKSASEFKPRAKRVDLVGFPSLRPDMFQESALKRSEAFQLTSIGETIYAPANDPFITASVINAYLTKYCKTNSVPNLYLCPLSTKPHTLGIILYFLCDLQNSPSTIIYPFAESQEINTSIGINKIWRYQIDFCSLQA